MSIVHMVAKVHKHTQHHRYHPQLRHIRNFQEEYCSHPHHRCESLEHMQTRLALGGESFSKT